MDPNANFRQTVALLERVYTWTDADRADYAELRSAYSDWRRNGGFSASHELRMKVAGLRARATVDGIDV